MTSDDAWVTGTRPGSADALLALTPATAPLRSYLDAVRSDPCTDPELLELCRRRMAQLLGADPAQPSPDATADLDDALLEALPRWPDDDRFPERTRAALAFAEQWLVDPSGITDEHCARLRAHLSEPECTAFTMGLSVAEAMLRFELVMGTLAPARP